MNDLIARINIEIERDIELATTGEDEQAHNERHWPDRIERQAAAIRKILDLHEIEYIEPTLDSGGRMMFPHGGWVCSVCSPRIDGDRVHDDGIACPTVLAIADIYEIEHP